MDPNTSIPWQPSASIDNLKQRAKIIKKIREFFYDRNVMEVETPLLGHTSVTDPFIESIPALLKSNSHKGQPYYLQTSPEYAMKRLLAAGSGPIFQICKAFRQGEIGRLHNPEFTMLEWYQPGYDHHKLMDEMDIFLQTILHCAPSQRLSYLEAFKKLGLDPHNASISDCEECAHEHHLVITSEINNKDTWLNLFMTHLIEPNLGQEHPCFIYDFPASQAALARIEGKEIPLAARFEVYVKGRELANGFHELQDAVEQRKRFEYNLAQRKQLKLAEIKLDEYFLSALTHGLPDCAGVALGIDRLIMLALQSAAITDVLSFDVSRI